MVTVAATAPVAEPKIAGAHDDESEEVDHPNESPETNGHHTESSEYLDKSRGEASFETQSQEMSQDLEDEDASHEVEPGDYEGAQEPGIKEPPVIASLDLHSPEGHLQELEHVNEPEVEVETEAESETAHIDESTVDASPSEEPHADVDVSTAHQIPVDGVAEPEAENADEPPAKAGNDIHDIVNLLETVPAVSAWNTRPLSVPGIPDDAPDIPDEE